MRNSPLAKTPPAKLASIPDIINEDADPPEEAETMSPEPPAPSKEGVPHSMCAHAYNVMVQTTLVHFAFVFDR